MGDSIPSKVILVRLTSRRAILPIIAEPAVDCDTETPQTHLEKLQAKVYVMEVE